MLRSTEVDRIKNDAIPEIQLRQRFRATRPAATSHMGVTFPGAALIGTFGYWIGHLGIQRFVH